MKWDPIIRVDNSEGKGPHIHIKDKEEKFEFVSVEETIKYILKHRGDLK